MVFPWLFLVFSWFFPFFSCFFMVFHGFSMGFHGFPWVFHQFSECLVDLFEGFFLERSRSLRSRVPTKESGSPVFQQKHFKQKISIVKKVRFQGFQGVYVF